MMATSTSNQSSATLLDREIVEFIIDRRARNLTPRTILWYQNSLGKLQEFAESRGISKTRDITPNYLRRFILHLGQSGHNDGGVVNIFGAVRTFLLWYESEYSPHDWENPLHKVQTPKRPDSIQQPIELPNFRALLSTCEPDTFAGDRDRALLLLLLDTGVRHAELASLNVGDVDMDSGEVLVRQGKGRKPRVVFVGARTQRALRAYMQHREAPEKLDPLWLARNGQRLKKSSIRQVVRRRAARAGIEEPGMHEFRRAFAVNFLRNGGDIFTLQRLLGHKDLRVVHRYLALVNDDLQRAHRKHGVVDRML